jgi:hypothetical protein
MIKGVLKALKQVSLVLPDYWLAYLYFVVRHRYLPNFKRPRSLSEKIGYVKLFNNNPLRRKISDRLWVRGYVAEKADDCKLINLIWTGDDFSEAVWNALPDEFVIKANHGAGMVKVVDKKRTSFQEIKHLAEAWLSRGYATLGREWFYKDLHRYLLVEEKLLVDGAVPPDFKFFCLSGNVELVQIDADRFSDHRRSLYSPKFDILDASLRYPKSEYPVRKPVLFAQAKKIAERLASDFDLVRVDLYVLDEGVYFGELTNAPGNGFERLAPRSLDFELGGKLPTYLVN